MAEGQKTSFDDCITAGKTPCTLEEESAVNVTLLVEDIVKQVVALATGGSHSSSDDFISSIIDTEFEKTIRNDTIKKMLVDTMTSSFDDDDKFKVNALREKDDKENGNEKLENYLPAEQAIHLQTVSGEGNRCFRFENNSADSNWNELTEKGGDGIGDSEQENSERNDDPTTTLLLSQILINENKNLTQQLGQMKRATAFLMSKYRNSVTSLQNEMDLYKVGYQTIVSSLENAAHNHHKTEVRVENERVRQMLLKIVGVDEKAKNAYEEEAARLRYENQGLRQLVKIAFDYGGERYHSYVDKSIQTDVVLEPYNLDNQSLVTMISNLKDNVTEYTVPVEREDDAESFHTADSLNSSFLSFGQDHEDYVNETFAIAEAISLATFAVVGNSKVVGDHDKVEIESRDANDLLDATSETSRRFKIEK